jgi:hypothetical protein
VVRLLVVDFLAPPDDAFPTVFVPEDFVVLLAAVLVDFAAVLVLVGFVVVLAPDDLAVGFLAPPADL